MSLWCGNCRQEIFEGFGLLYKLERTDDRKLRLPSKENDYVPPNSAICDPCWEKLPASEKRAGAKAEEEAERSADDVFAYALADSNNDELWGSKTWSGIEATEEGFVFVSSTAAREHLRSALEIIEKGL